MPPFGPDNPFWAGFETDPEGQRANYMRFQDQFRSPNQQEWFRNQFQRVQDRYRGLVGQQVVSQGQPTQTWTGFLDDWFRPGGSARLDYLRQSPQETGMQRGRFAPPARWLMNSGFGGPSF